MLSAKHIIMPLDSDRCTIDAVCSPVYEYSLTLELTMNQQENHTLGYDVVHVQPEVITLETKQSVLASVVAANARLPKFANDDIEMFINGVPYKL